MVSVIDETVEILLEIAQEYVNDEPDRENEVFLVNYNEWREVSTLDLEQNYFAIDGPYTDGDYRLLHLQNQIRNITPADVNYDSYEEAADALYEVECEMANMPFSKENNIGSYMVNGRTPLERIMEARQLTVAECGEFHNLGEYHENIASVEEAEAIAVWKKHTAGAHEWNSEYRYQYPYRGNRIL